MEDSAALPRWDQRGIRFQEYVNAVDYRVHVVGDDVYVCELILEADDYRYSERQNAGVSRRC